MGHKNNGGKEGMSGIRDLLYDDRANVVELKPKKVFSYEELNQVLPVIVRITKTYSEKVNKLIQRLDVLSQQDKATPQLECEVNALIAEWQNKVEKLGALTKGLWIADFDSGDGYFCWKFPEEQILYWHGYRDGFSGRRPVKEYLDKKSKENHEVMPRSNQYNDRSL